MAFQLRDLLRTVPERLYERDHCPTGKRVYYSKPAARYAARLENRYQRQAVHAFLCDYCGHYHLGHRRGDIW
jgi:ribosomal protein L32